MLVPPVALSVIEIVIEIGQFFGSTPFHQRSRCLYRRLLRLHLDLATTSPSPVCVLPHTDCGSVRQLGDQFVVDLQMDERTLEID